MSVIGTVELLATIDTSKYKKGATEIDDANEKIEKSAEKTEKNSNVAFSKISKIGLAGVVSAAVGAGVAIVSHIGDAIKRVDTLNNSTRTFQNMGFQMDEIKSSTSALKKSILGLPTSLDSAIQGVQLLAASTEDLTKSQKIYTALNNGILGFGGTADQVSNAVLQLSQDLAGGRIQAETWNSMLDSGLGPTLNAIAKTMGLTSRQLKSGLSDGTVSIDSFTNALISMNDKGGGGLQSLQKIAQDSTAGIGSGFSNMGTAITRGVADIIQSIGSENISSSITKIGTAFENSLKKVSAFIVFIKNNKDIFAPIAVAIGTVITAVTLWAAVTKTMAIAQAVLNAVLMANPIGLLIVGIAALVAGLVWFFTQTETGKKIASSFFETIGNLASAVIDWFKTNWPLLLAIITGPIGLAIYAIIKNFDTIKSAAQKLWDTISGFFVGVGSTIGNAVGNAFKSAVNGILGYLEWQINGIINVLNGALAAIDKITPGSLPRIDKVSIPRLAAGGIVMPQPGGILANIAEAGEPEAVIPLSKLDKILAAERGNNTSNQSNITINLSGVFATSKQEQRRVAEQIAQRLQEIQNSKASAGGFA